MKCKDCQYFHIDYEPIKAGGYYFDTGRASCSKYNVHISFLKKSKLKDLECIMITAEQAREIAQEKSADTVTELHMIEGEVKHAAQNEQFECWINWTIRAATRKELISLGYTVEIHDNQRDGYSVRISWEKNDRA